MRMRVLAGAALLAAVLAGGGTAVLAAQATTTSKVFIGTCNTEGQFVTCSVQGDIHHPSSITAQVWAVPGQRIHVNWDDFCSHGFTSPKLRLAGVADPALVWDFAIVKVRRSGYLRARGMAAPMSWKASRWVLVGSARIGTVAVVPAKRTWLRVRVARWPRRPRKLR